MENDHADQKSRVKFVINIAIWSQTQIFSFNWKDAKIDRICKKALSCIRISNKKSKTKHWLQGNIIFKTFFLIELRCFSTKKNFLFAEKSN